MIIQVQQEWMGSIHEQRGDLPLKSVPSLPPVTAPPTTERVGATLGSSPLTSRRRQQLGENKGKILTCNEVQLVENVYCRKGSWHPEQQSYSTMVSEFLIIAAPATSSLRSTHARTLTCCPSWSTRGDCLARRRC